MSAQKSLCQLEDSPEAVYCWHEHCATTAQDSSQSSAPLLQHSNLPSRHQQSPPSSSTSQPAVEHVQSGSSRGRESSTLPIEIDTSKELPKSPESSARASYVSSITPTSPLGTPQSEISALYPARSIEDMLAAGESTSIRTSLSFPDEQQLENIEYRRWQEFPVPPELSIVEDKAAPEIIKILHQSVVDQRQAAKASEDQRRPSIVTELSRSNTSSGHSIRSPMLANEEQLERDQPGLQVVPESTRPAEHVSDAHTDTHKFRINHRVSIAAMSLKSTNNSARAGSISSGSSSTKSSSKTIVPVGPMGFMQYNPASATQDRWVPPKPVSPWAEKFKKRKEKHKQSECIVCMTDLKNKDLVELDCKHKYCKPCFVRFTTTTMLDESSFPPKCCLQQVPYNVIQTYLDSDQKALYQQKEKEFSLPAGDRVYCPSPSCSKWIDTAKLSRNTSLSCSSCKTKVCNICRGEAHREWEACPQDFAMDATLQESARNGWQRCYACRTMVELSVGCRHITCKCKAEFCYVCGAKWQTCNCTEADQARRQQEIMDRRNIDDVEAAETAAAIRAVEEAQEAEAAEMIRQAESRLAKEGKAAEAYRQEMEVKFDKLRIELLAIHDRHKSEMDKRHDEERKLLREQDNLAEGEFRTKFENAKGTMAKEHEAKANALGNSHAKALKSLDDQHQIEEDDTFLEISAHLRGKPNRDARMKDMIEKLSNRQAEKRAYLVREQQVAFQNLLRREDASVIAYQDRLQSQEQHRKQEAHKQARWQTRHFWADGEWFTIVGEERKRMLDAEKRRQLSLDINRSDRPLAEEGIFGKRPPHPLEIGGRMNNEWGVSY